jgi:nitrate reductase delta subunit
MTMPVFSNPASATGSLRVMAALLSYPDAGMRGCLPAMPAILRRENALSAARLDELDFLIDTLTDAQPLEVEARYVELFDRGHSTSLHLFEHVHGDSRERGPAMVDLAQTYEQAGLLLAPGELPDYLPAVLEFAYTRPPREARAFLGEMTHVLNAIFSALQERASPYASVLGALIELAGEKAQAARLAAEPALDESWAEPAAFDGCSSKGQARPGQPQPIRIIPKNAATGALT